MSSPQSTVLVFGTFDIIHPGHEWFLRKAAARGDRLVAAVARDKFVTEWKGHCPVADEESRVRNLESSGLVDQAVLSDRTIRTYGVVDSVQPDVICLGHDQKALNDDLEQWLSGRKVRPEIVVLRPWKRRRYSSTRRNRALSGAGEGQTSIPWTLYILMFIAMGTFGFSWVSGKRISGTASPAALAVIRFALTALCFIPPLFVRKASLPAEKRILIEGALWTFAGALALGFYNILFFSGLDAGLAGEGGLIVTTLNPLFTVLILAFLERSLPRGGRLVGLGLGILGGILLLRPWSYSMESLLDSGNLLFLAAALAWSILTIVSRRAQKAWGFRWFNFGLYTMASLMLLPVALMEGPDVFAGLPGVGTVPAVGFWGDMIFISAITGAFGTGTYFIASSRLGAARGSAFTYLVPAFALGFTALAFGEIPNPWMILGGILAVAAVMLINKLPKT